MKEFVSGPFRVEDTDAFLMEGRIRREFFFFFFRKYFLVPYFVVFVVLTFKQYLLPTILRIKIGTLILTTTILVLK